MIHKSLTCSKEELYHFQTLELLKKFEKCQKSDSGFLQQEIFRIWKNPKNESLNLLKSDLSEIGQIRFSQFFQSQESLENKNPKILYFFQVLMVIFSRLKFPHFGKNSALKQC